MGRRPAGPRDHGYSAAAGEHRQRRSTPCTTRRRSSRTTSSCLQEPHAHPGYRMDNLDAYGESPPFVEEGYYNSSFSYVPLATPLYIPEGGSASTVTGYNNQPDVNDQSYFVSLTLQADRRPPRSTRRTTTWTRSSARPTSAASTPLYLDQTLQHEEHPLRGRLQAELPQQHALLRSPVFQQLKYGSPDHGRQVPDQGQRASSSRPSTSRTRPWNFNANFTYQEATTFGVFYQSTGNYLDAFATTTPVDGTYGTGLGAPNFTALPSPRRKHALAGHPAGPGQRVRRVHATRSAGAPASARSSSARQ